MSFQETMNTDPPPERIDAFDVDLHALLYAIPMNGGLRGKVQQFSWAGTDYYRYQEDDGSEWFYRADSLRDRLGLP